MEMPLKPAAGGLDSIALRKMMERNGTPQDGRGMEAADVAGGAMKMRYGGKVKKMAMGGKVTRGDGACMKGHTKGRMV